MGAITPGAEGAATTCTQTFTGSFDARGVESALSSILVVVGVVRA